MCIIRIVKQNQNQGQDWEEPREARCLFQKGGGSDVDQKEFGGHVGLLEVFEKMAASNHWSLWLREMISERGSLQPCHDMPHPLVKALRRLRIGLVAVTKNRRCTFQDPGSRSAGWVVRATTGSFWCESWLVVWTCLKHPFIFHPVGMI